MAVATVVRSRGRRISLWVAFALVLGATSAHGQVVHHNLAELTTLAPDIIVGRVTSVSDGTTAANVPFTEVSVALHRTVKGKLTGTHTFRQFGLLQPRPAADGRTNLMLTPAGWPSYSVDEEVMLFLYHPGRATGLRTTVGLDQGKFTIADGKIVNANDNAGLMDRVSLPATRAARGRAVLADRGAADAATFIDLVATAVREKWFDAAR